MSQQEREAALAHFGVKGMKWGQRKNDASGGNAGGSSKKAARPTTGQILNARANTQAHLAKIYAADQDVRTATTKAGKDAALKVVEKHAKAIGQSDDTRVANMLTKGERVTNVLVAGPIGLLVNHANTKATSKAAWDKKRATS